MATTEVLKAVKARIDKEPELNAALTASWNKVYAAIEAHTLANFPSIKDYVMHRAGRTAREAFLVSVANGNTLEQAELDSLKSIGL